MKSQTVTLLPRCAVRQVLKLTNVATFAPVSECVLYSRFEP